MKIKNMNRISMVFFESEFLFLLILSCIFYFIFCKEGERVSKFEKCEKGETQIRVYTKQITALSN